MAERGLEPKHSSLRVCIPNHHAMLVFNICEKHIHMSVKDECESALWNHCRMFKEISISFFSCNLKH